MIDLFIIEHTHASKFKKQLRQLDFGILIEIALFIDEARKDITEEIDARIKRKQNQIKRQIPLTNYF